MDSFVELHSHLYGCISAETLWNMAKFNPSPRWEIFTSLYKQLYQKDFSIDTFFDDYQDMDKFKSLYHFKRHGSFLEFQSCFNLIIAFARLDADEVREVSRTVLLNEYKNKVQYGEYRIMFSPAETKESFYKKIKAASEGFREAELDCNHQIRGRLIVSLSRGVGFWEGYSYLKEFLEIDDLIGEYFVGIDFCAVEEGFPPKDKRSFIKQVLEDNQKKPKTALSISYHVGESYEDKTPNSAIRWILEATEYGVHRLGHCIALGLRSDFYLNKTINEIAIERKDQLQFELDNYLELESFGAVCPMSKIQKEIESISKVSPDQTIEICFDERHCTYLENFQNYAFYKLKQKNVVIESCPTSNLYIGRIPEKSMLPSKVFIEKKLNVVIGADDPGILDTNLSLEYEILQSIGVSESALKSVQDNAIQFQSNRLSNRYIKEKI